MLFVSLQVFRPLHPQKKQRKRRLRLQPRHLLCRGKACWVLAHLDQPRQAPNSLQAVCLGTALLSATPPPQTVQEHHFRQQWPSERYYDSSKGFSSLTVLCLLENRSDCKFHVHKFILSPLFLRCWTTAPPLAHHPTPVALDQQKVPAWGLDIGHPLRYSTPLEAKRTTWRIWKAWRGSFAQKRKRVTAAS